MRRKSDSEPWEKYTRDFCFFGFKKNVKNTFCYEYDDDITYKFKYIFIYYLYSKYKNKKLLVNQQHISRL